MALLTRKLEGMGGTFLVFVVVEVVKIVGVNVGVDFHNDQLIS